MFDTLIKKVFGSQSDREFKKTQPQIEEVSRIAEGLKSLSDSELQQKTAQFRQQMRQRTASQRQRLGELDEQLRGDLEPALRERYNDEFEEVDKAIREHETEFLGEIMPEAFAIVKDACRRLIGKEWERAGESVTWEMQPYDVQIFGGTMLHQGKIAEMATGEGKTLVATMPIYLNALPARGVHLITHNEYLARRDGMWMGPLFNF